MKWEYAHLARRFLLKKPWTVPISIRHRRFFSDKNTTNTEASAATSPNSLVNVFLSYYYHPTALKCTSGLFGIFGVIVAEVGQDDVYAYSEEKASLQQRLFIDAVSAFVFSFGGFYLHLFLPAHLIVFSLLALQPDEEATDSNVYSSESDKGEKS